MAMAVDLSGPGLPSEKVDGSKSLYACLSVCKGYPSYIIYSIKLSQLLPSEYISKSKSEGCGISSDSDSVTLCSSPTSTLTPISYPTISTSNSSSSSSSKEQEGCNSYSELKWNRFTTLGGNGLPYGMNCCVMGSKIILAGGLFKSSEYSTWIFTLETNPALDPKPEFQNINKKKKKKMKNNNNRKNNFSLKPLSAGKSDPLLVEIEGRLYALAGIPLVPFEELPSPTFEVFDPSTQQWSPLPPPPFFNRNEPCCFAPWHYNARACFDYFVMDSRISVCGPFSVGYTFDIPTKKWIRCSHFAIYAPFPFAGMGLMIKLSARGDKAIIGHDQHDNCLRAYFLHYSYGHCQSVPIPVDIPPEFAYCRPNFVHLGDGIICVVMAIVVAEFEELRIFVATFQVSRVNRRSIYLDLWEKWVTYDLDGHDDADVDDTIANRCKFIRFKILNTHLSVYKSKPSKYKIFSDCIGAYLL